LLSGEQVKAINEEFKPVEVDPSPQPLPELDWVVGLWQRFGSPVAFSGGGFVSVTLLDQRAMLFGPRRQLLDEEGITEQGLRGAVLDLFEVLDRTQLELAQEQLEEAQR
jgi:hypothetical protein